jgi:hypothetical protein
MYASAINPKTDPVTLLEFEAALRFGRVLAETARSYLEQVNVSPTREMRGIRPIPLTPNLIELGALIWILWWEQSGVCSYFEGEMPSVWAAVEYLESRLSKDLHAFDLYEEFLPVTKKVFKIWAKYIAWSGLEEMHADVVLQSSEADEERLLEHLADLLWKYRHLA